MKPYFSVIIPYHNSLDTISRLLISIARSKKAPPYEVIIVNDGSAAFTISALLPKISKKRTQISRNSHVGYINNTNIRIVHLVQNVGPAIARNRGVKVAKGNFVVFLDGDVEVFDDTLSNLARIYQEDPDIVAVTGVWVKEQRSKDFFPNFKALRDWSYWINERDKSGYYFLFSTRIASIKRSVFQRLGGFNEKYPAPLVEDIELTYRIARRYAIIFAPNVRVRHEFESFWPIAKKYFLRAYYWTKLYQGRKKFDPVATTLQEAMTTLSGVGSVIGGAVSLLLLPTLPVVSSVTCQVSGLGRGLFCLYPFIIWYGTLLVIIMHIYLVHKFLLFLYKERGLNFAIKGFFVGLALYCFIFAGALWGRLRA